MADAAGERLSEEEIDAIMNELGYEEGLAPEFKDTKVWLKPDAAEDDPAGEVYIPISCPRSYLVKVLRRNRLPIPDYLAEPDGEG